MSIGEQLRKIRESKHQSLEQAAQATHIRLKYLQALENDDYLSLPSDVQGKGFLRLYADFLGLPVLPLLDQWNNRFTPAVKTQDSNASQQTNDGNDTTSDTSGSIKPKPQIDLHDQNETNISQSTPQKAPEIEQPVVIQETKAGLIFEEIGQKIRDQRENLGLSLSDVERHTHIRSHYLQRIEEGRIDLLPSSVQGRGMVSSYARFLEMETESILLRFAEGLQAERMQKLAEQQKPQEEKPKKITKRMPPWRMLLTPDVLVGGGVVVLFLALSIWGISRISSVKKENSQPTAPSISQILLNSSDEMGTTTATFQSEFVSPDMEFNGTPVAQSGGSEILATATFPVIDNAPLQIYIIAHQRAWMRIISDGKEVYRGRVVPGNAYPFSGNEQVELLTGNAAALQVYFNQTDLGILGVVGQAMGLNFTKNGMQTPTPIFTATATQTIAPTMTLQPSPTVPTATVTPYIP
jgi:cytoskeleton protein RodZ